MKKSTNINIFLEVFWLILAIVNLSVGIVIMIKTGFKASYMFFVLSLLSLFLYLARRWVRKNSEIHK